MKVYCRTQTLLMVKATKCLNLCSTFFPTLSGSTYLYFGIDSKLCNNHFLYKTYFRFYEKQFIHVGSLKAPTNQVTCEYTESWAIFFFQNKEEGKYQQSTTSCTKPDRGYHFGRKHHTQESTEVSPFTTGDHKAVKTDKTA